MGYISDNTRSRWGRRRPYIFAGAILAGLVFAAMWQLPPGHSESFYFWTFMTASIFYFLTYTVYATPFVAFGFEMTPDYHERTRLQAFANTAGQVAWLGVPWFYAIMASNWFTDTAHGARVLALWVGGAICVWESSLRFFAERRWCCSLILRKSPNNPANSGTSSAMLSSSSRESSPRSSVALLSNSVQRPS